jgi:hypothetical protein
VVAKEKRAWGHSSWDGYAQQLTRPSLGKEVVDDDPLGLVTLSYVEQGCGALHR